MTEKTNVNVVAPEGMGAVVVSALVAPSYVVPAADAAVMPSAPVVLILIRWLLASNATLFGAVTTLPVIVKLDEPCSIRNASLNCVPTYSGNSSEKNFHSTAHDCAPGGTFKFNVNCVKSVACDVLLPFKTQL